MTFASRLADMIDPPELKWTSDPALWAKERAGVDLWSKQREILAGLVAGDVAVHSCHSAGKSFTAAAASAWWIDAHPPQSAFVVTTAPTGDQVAAVLWREIGRLHKRANLPGRMNLTEWYVGKELVALGRKPNNYEPTAFQGIHAEFVLVVIDEACGVAESLWHAAGSLTSNTGSRILAIGNPDDPMSYFARACQSGRRKVVHIGYADTPNFTGEKVPAVVRASLIGQEYVDKMRDECGESSSLFQSKVLGLFPVDADDGIVKLSWVQRCRELELPEGQPIEAGLDLGASEGGDRTVLRLRRGNRAGEVATWNEPDPMKLVGQVAWTLDEWKVERVKVDVIGIGWGFAGRLEELSRKHGHEDGTHNAEVVRVNVSERANSPDRFTNQRAEMWWEVGRERSRLGTWDLADVDDATVAELTAPRFEIVDSNGKIKVELKSHVKQRLGRSPDGADALLLAFFSPYEQSSVPLASQSLMTMRIPGVRDRNSR